MRVIIFKNISSFTLLFCIFLRISGFSIYYMELSRVLRSKKGISFLSFCGIEPVNMEECKHIDGELFFSDKERIIDSILNDLIYNESELSMYSPLFDGVMSLNKKLHVYLYSCISKSYNDAIRMRIFLESYFPDITRAFVVLPGRGLEKKLFASSRVKITNIAVSVYILLAFHVLFLFFVTILNKIISFFKFGKSKQIKAIHNKTPGTLQSPFSYFKVIFFPHKSIYSGKLFKKDQFYSKNPDSSFYFKNILHIELNKPSNRRAEELLELQRAEKAPFDFFPSPLIEQWLFWFIRYILFWCRNLGKFMEMKHRVFVFFSFLELYLLFCKYNSGLAKYSSAKIALIGYEILVPIPLMMALESRHIKSFAAQERMVHTFQKKHKFVVDVYLCISNYVAEIIKKSSQFCVNEIYPIGAVRSDKLHKYKKIHYPYMSDLRDKFVVITALDYHSEINKIDALTSPITNYKANKQFYLDLIRLALMHRNIYIIIRGKNDDWCTLPEFIDIFNMISSMPNITVNRDYNELDVSYKLCAQTDLVIAKYTSLVDECIAVGISTLVHDYTHNIDKVISPVFDNLYHQIFCHNFVQLNEKVQFFLKTGNIMPKQDFEKLRVAMFEGLCDGHVCSRIHSLLQQQC